MFRKSILLITMIIAGGFLFANPLKAQKPNQEGLTLNVTYLVGKWKGVTAYAVNVPPMEQLRDSVAKADTSKSAGTQRRGGDKSAQAMLRQRQTLDNIAANEAGSTVEFFPNKTATKLYNGKTFNATWKLKKKSIIAKDKKSKEKFKMEVQKFGIDDMNVIEHTRFGDVFVHYTRVK